MNISDGAFALSNITNVINQKTAADIESISVLRFAIPFHSPGSRTLQLITKRIYIYV
jgi:hypothetical protein